MVSVDMLTYDASNTKAVADLRKDMLSLHRLIHTSTTRLSVSLGKPPPSYSLAQVPLKDLASQVVQLTSCTCSYPPGTLRREAISVFEGTIRALTALVRHFEKQCRQGGTGGEEYLAKTAAVHDAVTSAESLSSDETEAIITAWKANGETLEDSLKEVKEMEDEQSSENGGDGWDELGEDFGRKLKPEERQRVKQVGGVAARYLCKGLHGASSDISSYAFRDITSRKITVTSYPHTARIAAASSVPPQ
jgi:Grap2 and cyclin-D-interacting, N-terminal